MKFETVIVEIRERLGFISLNRPDKMNTFSSQLARECLRRSLSWRAAYPKAWFRLVRSYLPRAAHVSLAEVRIAGLPQALDGFRLAVVSDLHVGPLMTPASAHIASTEAKMG